MNILYYIPELDQANGGARQYSIALLSVLSKDESGNHYYVLHNRVDSQVAEIISHTKNMTLIPAAAGREKKYQWIWRHLNRFFNLFLAKTGIAKRTKNYYYLNSLCKKYTIDIVHFPGQYNPLVTGIKRICTAHDVQELHFPDYFTGEERRDRAIQMVEKLSIADLVIVSYNHVKNDLIRFFRLPADKVMVCLLDMGNLWFKKQEGKPIADLSSLHLPATFLLYPANTWKHKNHSSLLKAVAYLRDEKNYIVNLVCTGDKNNNFTEVLLPLIKELKLEGQVQFPGVVNEEILYALYQQCTGVVVPTSYEAGSFPLMESMIMGIPVICSDVTSLPETIDDSQYIFAPFDIADMAAKMLKLYSDEEYRAQNIINSNKKSGAILHTGALQKLQAAYLALMNKEN